MERRSGIRRTPIRRVGLRRQSPHRKSRRSEHFRHTPPSKQGEGYYDEEGGHSKKMEDSGRAAKENRAKKSAPKEEDGAVQQQAVLESLASYLEGELMIRLQSYTDLVAEVESLNKERLFYYEKLRRVEKACSQTQSYVSMPLVESIRAILGATTDRPTPS